MAKFLGTLQDGAADGIVSGQPPRLGEKLNGLLELWRRLNLELHAWDRNTDRKRRVKRSASGNAARYS